MNIVSRVNTKQTKAVMTCQTCLPPLCTLRVKHFGVRYVLFATKILAHPACPMCQRFWRAQCAIPTRHIIRAKKIEVSYVPSVSCVPKI